MAESVIELEALLQPLPAGEGGVGDDPRADEAPNSPYRRLRDARFEARSEERAQEASGDTEGAVPTAWREVKRLGMQCLAEKAKDFEVACWLAEALVRLDGLAGLTAAAQLIEGLLDRYWEHGHPVTDEDGLDMKEVRSAPLGGLSGEGADGTLMQPLRRMALFRRADGSPVGLHLWQVAEDTAAIPADTDENKKRREARLKAGVPLLSALENEARADAAYLRGMASAARRAGRAWTAMDTKLNERFGSEAPPTRRVADALARMLDIGVKLIGSVRDDAPPPQEAPPPEAGNAEGGDAAGPAEGSGGSGRRALRTRDDAIRQLEELAEFFRRTEPHSPLAYTLDHAVRRARMQLPDLLAEVLPDEKMRQAMLTMLGIRAFEPPPPPEPAPAAPAKK